MTDNGVWPRKYFEKIMDAPISERQRLFDEVPDRYKRIVRQYADMHKMQNSGMHKRHAKQKQKNNPNKNSIKHGIIHVL